MHITRLTFDRHVLPMLMTALTAAFIALLIAYPLEVKLLPVAVILIGLRIIMGAIAINLIIDTWQNRNN